ncbi:MAG: hypothetical protein AVDCRST_MAG60-290 [uncultured Nocardioides sp.]|uniref:Uncharacterized protein n=1 Tax=uncultured Nocardioides sp. TaxID=198441 RepID=A0A6J4MZQ0_9ACTN|nr:MAG: hypothetical protein AVDCRST_MAG60-290 [uncultured Nocardioides sp.]
MNESQEHPHKETSGDGRGVESSVVAEVLASIESIDTRPVAEHVTVFEHAHERLRRALEPRHG